jgi:hypothetical protein
MDTVAERLGWALETLAPEAIRGDKKAFRAVMNERLKGEREGTSYPAVLGYFSGATSPSVRWLNVAADVLGVRPPWLLAGQGAPTEDMATPDELDAYIMSLLREGCRDRGFEPPPLVATMFADVVKLFVIAESVALGPKLRNSVDALAQAIGERLFFPVLHLRADGMSQARFTGYALTFLQSLRTVAVDVIEGAHGAPMNGGNDDAEA